MKALSVLVFIPLLTSPVLAQPNDRDMRGGILIGSLSRYGEDVFEGTNSTLGGWVEMSVDRWALELDIARSRQQRTREEGCIRGACDGTLGESAPATRRERNWTIGIEALRRLRTSGADVPYFLVGATVITRHNSLVFDDPGLPSWHLHRLGIAPTAGVGLDVFAGRAIVRVQYRLQMPVFGFIGAAAAQQFRAGVGWDF